MLATIVNQTNVINSSKVKLQDNLELHIINFSDYDDSYKELLDKYLAYLCEGTNDVKKLKRVKQRIRNYLDGKKNDPTKVAGWLAELYCHIYLTENKFKPAFLFQNLEEQNSMKKGFDGFYIKKDAYFIYESKSNLPSDKTKCHNEGLKVAYNDLKKKVEGKNISKNKKPIDPWTNALNHYKLSNIKKSKTLVAQLDEIIDNFFDSKFLQINDCNIIPSSTIYLDSKYHEIDKKALKKLINDNSSYFVAKNNILLCINKKSFDYIKDYLNG